MLFIIIAATSFSQTHVRFCDLVQNPDEYNGKEVAVRATYRYGFEWQELYCLNCVQKGKAWLELPDDEGISKALRHVPKGAGIVNATFQGVFLSGGHFGHMGGYAYKFVARKVSDVVVLQKGMRTLAEQQETEQKYACGGTSPK